MQEPLLQFAWQFQLFEKQRFELSNGQPLQVIFPGHLNTSQGPDFLYARLNISGILWVGAVELHLNGQDWYTHEHHQDAVYNSVVLHVVLKASAKKPLRSDGTEIPELILTIPDNLTQRYRSFLSEKDTISCRDFLPNLPNILVNQWFTRLGIARFERKSAFWEQQKTSQIDYLELLWQATAMAIAGPVNQQPFQEMARLVPFSLIRHYQKYSIQVNALLFGVTGLLSEPSDNEYAHELRQEWAYLQEKHQLKRRCQSPFYFFRVRPSGFPTIRLAQLAALIQYEPYWQLTSALLPIDTALISQNIHPYWQTHYRFTLETPPHSVRFSKELLSLMKANALIPIQLSYFSSVNPEVLPYLISSLEELPPEKNRYLKYFEMLNFTPKSMLHSQGIVECVTRYCQPKRCLECQFGQTILTSTKIS